MQVMAFHKVTLIQEGNLGLMKAGKTFRPKYGRSLVSFAVHWIKAEIHEYVIRNWRIVKIAPPKHNVNYSLICVV